DAVDGPDRAGLSPEEAASLEDREVDLQPLHLQQGPAQPSCSCSQQAAPRSGEPNQGGWIPQRSTARGQRGAKGQPAPSAARSGGEPSIGVSAPRVSRRGTLASRPRV